jgi:hypothetical protein
MDSTNGGGSKVVIGGFAAYANMHTPNTWELYYAGTKGDTYWAGAAGNFIHYTGVQLEKGTVATPFEFRPYATELALCQRYYVRWTAGGQYVPLGMGTAYSTTYAQSNMMLPVPMRAQPTLLEISAGSVAWGSAITQGTNVFTTNDVYFASGAVNYGFTAIAGSNFSASPYNYITLQLGNGTATGVSTPMTPGYSGTFYMPNTAGKYIAIGAEL